MSEPEHPDREHPGKAGVDTQPNTDREPTFLGEDYVCTELPTHITRARTKEQQAFVDQAYEGWANEV